MSKSQRNMPDHGLFHKLKNGAGQVAMVMVGVLLALWVQNWNDDRKDVIKEAKLLREMHRNLSSDLEDCRENIVANQRLLRSNQAVLKQLAERTPFQDTLRMHYANIFGSTTLTTNLAAYDNLKSIGFHMVRNDSLRQMITTLYSDRYRYLHDMEMEVDVKFQQEQILPMVNAKVVMDTTYVSAFPIDAEALMDDAPFKGMLRTNIFYRQSWIVLYQGVETRILALQEMIDNELAGRE